MILAVSSQLSWYLTRGAGFVALLALTGSVILGILSAQRWAVGNDSRVRFAALHGNLALIGLSALVLHIATAVYDPFTHLGILTALDPFGRPYRALWLGLGVFASDMFIAVVVTSLLRHKLGYKSWKYIHFASYAIWAMAMVHGLGTGSDSRFLGFQVIYLGSLIAVISAVWVRVLSRWDGANRNRLMVAAVTALFPAVIVGWALAGPTKASWAARFASKPKLAGAVPVAYSKDLTNPKVSVGGTVYGVSKAISAKGGYVIAGSFVKHPGVVFEVAFMGATQGSLTKVSSTEVMVGTPSNPAMFKGPAAYFTPNFVGAKVQSATGKTLYVQLDVAVSKTQKLFGAGLVTTSVQKFPVIPPTLPQKTVTIIEKVPVVQQVPVYVNVPGGGGGDN